VTYRAIALLMLGVCAAQAAEREVLLRPGLDPASVEYFVSRPDGPGPFRVVVFAHGHQSAPRPGGRVFTALQRRPALATVDEGRLDLMRHQGWLAIAISLPGYGDTPGPSDFWGLRSQAALRALLDHVPEIRGADPSRMALYGVSGGAATASVVAAERADLRALILVAGMYDLGTFYPTGERGMDEQVERSAGTSPIAFATRSGLSWATRIVAATLLLHGAQDRASTVAQSQELARRIPNARVQVLEGVPHSIPIALQWQWIGPFLEQAVPR
jgi:pimeloyl-ACP methyl ester carboxylesterase